MPPRRTVGESPEFRKQLGHFGDAKFTDKLIETVINRLSLFPYAFPELVPGSNIRHVKTNEFFSDGKIIPPLKIWFTILNDNHVLITGLSRQIEDEFDEFIDG